MTSSDFPVRLYGVKGCHKRTDNVLYHPPVLTTNNDESNAVVYFGGDIQNFSDEMEGNSRAREYVNWSLDQMAVKLSTFFPTCKIIVIQPSSYDYEIYSHFDNFVPSTTYGIPEYQLTYNSLVHLKILLENIEIEIKKMCESRKWDGLLHNTNSFSNSKLFLIGFSKGCIVLNQFIHEFYNHSRTQLKDNDVSNLIAQISDMYFLDGGHGGKKNTWITSDELLKNFSKLSINIHVHVTPYQICDKTRPWIGQEESKFYTILKSYNAPLSRIIHFEHESRSLDKHFELLSVFNQC